MKVVRGGCPAGGTIVEHGVVPVFHREIKHVREMVPYLLRDMLLAHYHKVTREDRVRVDLYAVVSPLAALKFEVKLLRGSVFLAEEALSGRYGLRAGVGCARDDTAGVELDGTEQPVHLQLPGPDGLESPEI